MNCCWLQWRSPDLVGLIGLMIGTRKSKVYSTCTLAVHNNNNHLHTTMLPRQPSTFVALHTTSRIRLALSSSVAVSAVSGPRFIPKSVEALSRQSQLSVPVAAMSIGSLFTREKDVDTALKEYSAYTGFHLDHVREKKGFIIDMDGVLYHQNKLVEGADKFVNWLQESNKKFLFLTNASDRSPRELSEKLKRLGIKVGEKHFYTSALATAAFLAKHVPPGNEGSAYVIGDPGLTSALYDAGISMNDIDPDFVVVGETKNYNYEKLEHAVHLVRAGARLIGTNQDVRDRKGDSFIPACGALIKPIELTSGATAYFVGKPNPMMMRAAIEKLGVQLNEVALIGDRMDTDILGGVQTEIHTVLTLSGVTSLSDLPQYAFRPHCVVKTVGDIVPGKFSDLPGKLSGFLSD
eukprot:TRINITY_DN967_c0_g1_i1.p1 TRINITY_DN967_c0_g1~~TRINITY_DN967_c0_g1_i1.p1  ORF type:complete len:406 (+),score=89.46 TRINITY_DN967_c0_g1_i1:1246-2463(+)